VEFKQIKPDEIETLFGRNVIMVVSNGVINYKELPEYGKTSLNLTTHENKVTLIEENISKKTKLV